MIEALGLGKSYGGKVVVQDVAFTAPAGSVTGFLGANGAGKTTTIRLMLGLEVGAGSTLYAGRLLADWPDPAQVVGAVVDAASFSPHVPARRQLRALARAVGVDPQTAVPRVLDLVGLSDAADRPARHLSQGMLQRLGLAAAMLGDPRVLVLDEPGNGLDPPTLHWLRRWLRGLADEGRTVFLSSHLLSELQLLADRVVVLAEGRVAAEESVEDFLARGPGEVVLVETADAPALARALAVLGATAEPVPGSGGQYRVLGSTRLAVAEQLWLGGVRVSLLATEQQSLEDAYLQVAGLGDHVAGQLA